MEGNRRPWLKGTEAPRPEAAPVDNLWVPGLRRSRRPGPALDPDRPHITRGMSTRAVHAGQYDDPVTGAVGTPIFQNTTFHLAGGTYDAIEDGRAREHFIYSRYGNPTQWALQEKLANLEGAESALVFSSGMAAITTSILALNDPGGHIVTSRDLYGGTYNFFNEDAAQLGMSVDYADPMDLDAVARLIGPKTKILFFESLTNPLLKPADVEGLSRLAERNGLRLIIDNTFLSPMNLRPLEYGVDVVVHSGSKYLNGHSDLIAGTAAGSRKLIDRVWAQMLKLGGSLDPHAAFLFERGLKTFALRMRTHNENAAAVARFLAARPEVARVHHPSLPEHPGYETACRLTAGGGGVVAFEVVGGDAAAHRLLSALEIPKEATSLGGVESLVSLPYNTSHASLTSSQLRAVGIQPGLVRLSVGIEDLGDLLTDLKQGLEYMNSHN